MTTWTPVSTSATSWTSVPETAQGYFETEDNLSLIATENNELLQQEDKTDIDLSNGNRKKFLRNLKSNRLHAAYSKAQGCNSCQLEKR